MDYLRDSKRFGGWFGSVRSSNDIRTIDAVIGVSICCKAWELIGVKASDFRNEGCIFLPGCFGVASTGISTLSHPYQPSDGYARWLPK